MFLLGSVLASGFRSPSPEDLAYVLGALPGWELACRRKRNKLRIAVVFLFVFGFLGLIGWYLFEEGFAGAGIVSMGMVVAGFYLRHSCQKMEDEVLFLQSCCDQRAFMVADFEVERAIRLGTRNTESMPSRMVYSYHFEGWVSGDSDIYSFPVDQRLFEAYQGGERYPLRVLVADGSCYLVFPDTMSRREKGSVMNPLKHSWRREG